MAFMRVNLFSGDQEKSKSLIAIGTAIENANANANVKLSVRGTGKGKKNASVNESAIEIVIGNESVSESVKGTDAIETGGSRRQAEQTGDHPIDEMGIEITATDVQTLDAMAHLTEVDHFRG